MWETQETWVQSLGGKDQPEEEMATHTNILAGKFHGQRCLARWGHRELDTTEHTSNMLRYKCYEHFSRETLLCLHDIHSSHYWF